MRAVYAVLCVFFYVHTVWQCPGRPRRQLGLSSTINVHTALIWPCHLPKLWLVTEWYAVSCAPCCAALPGVMLCCAVLCSVAVPRKAKEAIGAIARLTATDGSGRAMTVGRAWI
jgi:hypothetical protein